MPPTGHSTEYTGGGGGGGSPSGLGSTGISGLQHTVPGVAATPGWTVVGDYFYVKGKVALEISLVCSNSALQARARLFDTVANAQVAGSLLTFPAPTTTDTRQMTGDVSATMVAGRLYQIQVECTGGATQSDLATVRSERVLES